MQQVERRPNHVTNGRVHDQHSASSTGTAHRPIVKDGTASPKRAKTSHEDRSCVFSFATATRTHTVVVDPLSTAFEFKRAIPSHAMRPHVNTPTRRGAWNKNARCSCNGVANRLCLSSVFPSNFVPKRWSTSRETHRRQRLVIRWPGRIHAPSRRDSSTESSRKILCGTGSLRSVDRSFKLGRDRRERGGDRSIDIWGQNIEYRSRSVK